MIFHNLNFGAISLSSLLSKQSSQQTHKYTVVVDVDVVKVDGVNVDAVDVDAVKVDAVNVDVVAADVAMFTDIIDLSVLSRESGKEKSS